MSELRSYECPECGALIPSGDQHHCKVVQARKAAANGCLRKLERLATLLLLGMVLIAAGNYWFGIKPASPPASSVTKLEAAPAVEPDSRTDSVPATESLDAFFIRLAKKWGLFGIAGFVFVLLAAAACQRVLTNHDRVGLFAFFVLACLIGAAIWWHYHLFLPA